MLNRRKLFGFAAAAPVAVIGLKPEKAKADDAPEGPLVTFASGNPSYRMSLSKREEEEKRMHVHLSIGKDGRLWMKSGDRWHRIAVEEA